MPPLQVTVYPRHTDPYAAFEPFDADAGAGSAPEGGGDPYAHFEPYGEPAAAPAREIGRGEAVARGAAEGLSFGFEPVLEGVAEAGGPRPDTIGGRASGAAARRPAAGLARIIAEKTGFDPFGLGGADFTSPVTGDEGPGVRAYRATRDAERQRNQEAYEQHPYSYLGGELAGALTTPLPLGSLEAATAAGRIGKAARSGAIAGGLGGVGESLSAGGEPGDAAAAAAEGAALGGIAGGGGSGAIEGVGRLGRKLADIIRGGVDPELQAARGVVGARAEDLAAGSGGIDPSAEAAAVRAGLPLTNLDFGGQTTRDLARTAANVSPHAWGELERVTSERAEARPQRIASVINRLFGGNLDAGADQLRLQQEARRANAPAYERAYAAGDRPVWSPELERLAAAPAVQDAMRSAITSGQNRAIEQGLGAFNPGVSVTPDGRLLMGQTLRGGAVRGTPTYPSLQYWDYVQRDLADMVERVQGREPDKARYLNSLHQQLNSELDRLVPEFERARTGAWRFFKAQDASEAGRNFVRMDGDPREARRALAQMNRPEQELFARGFADELAQSVLKLPNTLATIRRVFTSPLAAEKIRVALGAPRARELEALLRAEAIAEKSKQALGNSTTARQQEMIRAFKATGAAHGLAGAGAIGAFEFLHDGDFDPRTLLGTALIVGMVKGGAHKIDTRVMRRIGEMLASSDPAVASRGAAAVAHSPKLMAALRAGTDAGTRITAREIGPDRALAGSAAVLSDIVAHEEAHHNAAHPDNQQAPQP